MHIQRGIHNKYSSAVQRVLIYTDSSASYSVKTTGTACTVLSVSIVILLYQIKVFIAAVSRIEFGPDLLRVHKCMDH